jgi:uncharacterized integral membrane protein
VKAMVEIVLRMGWSYISIIYEESNYGVKAFEELEELLGENNICIAIKEKLVKDSGVAVEKQYDNIVQKLLTKSRARGEFSVFFVVILLIWLMVQNVREVEIKSRNFENFPYSCQHQCQHPCILIRLFASEIKLKTSPQSNFQKLAKRPTMRLTSLFKL